MGEHKHFTKHFKYALLIGVGVPLTVGVAVGLWRHRTDPGTAFLWGFLAGFTALIVISWIMHIFEALRIVARLVSNMGGRIGAGLGCCWWMATALLDGDTGIAYLIVGCAFFGTLCAAIGFFVDLTLSLGMRIGPLLGGVAFCALMILNRDGDVIEPVRWVLVLVPGAGIGSAIGGLLELGLRWLFDRSVQFYVPVKRTEQWALALGGPLTHLNGESLVTLRTRYSRKDCRLLLADPWNIRDRSDANHILRWFMDEGYNAGYQGRCKEVSRVTDSEFDEYLEERSPEERESYDWVRRQLEKTGTTNIIAWDAGWLIQIARWCHGAGYLTKKQAWDWIFRAARRVQSVYQSWDEYADHCAVGYQFRRVGDEGDEDDESRDDFLQGLRWLQNDPESPWQDLEWRTPVDSSGD